ncbi:hypothetical protein PIECOFPK_01319 [Mycovorax composti]|uniref:Uncharacterized protein n=1 Tax=Mycovorax composti TaxID=2962693 RepID=A0ABZ2EJY0_9BACT
MFVQYFCKYFSDHVFGHIIVCVLIFFVSNIKAPSIEVLIITVSVVWFQCYFVRLRDAVDV